MLTQQIILSITVAIVTSLSSVLYGQLPTELRNGNLEDVNSGSFSGWKLSSDCNAKLKIDESTAYQGQRAAIIDATEKRTGGRGFSNFIQGFDATPYQGKRIRFRAAVKTADLAKSARAQLWCRVDCKDPKSEQVTMGAFDNMDDRPIRSDQWSHYEIVLDIEKEATSIVLGMFLIGEGRAFIDDISFEVTTEDVKPTGKSMKGQGSGGYQPPAAVTRAFKEADSAPTQPFWNFWLLLPFTAFVLFIAGVFPKLQSEPTGETTSSTATNADSRWIRFCFRFTFAYWVVYGLPGLIAKVVPIFGLMFIVVYESANAFLIKWVAQSVLGIQKELVPPNGSGDTTYNYVSILSTFCIAFVIAIAWTLLDRRSTNYRISRDLLQIFLRYMLGLTLLGYGLAKLSFELGQFPPPQPFQLDKTWGESSPMNVLWAFMGYSRAYTFFAGFGEVVAGLLLVWRRTATLGALVSIGVMANVVMLNFSYDVPVKILSTHLLVMAILIATPDAIRLLNLLVFNRSTAAANLTGPWTNLYVWRAKLAIKLLVLIYTLGLPVVYQCISLAAEIRNTKEPTTEDDFRQNYLLTKRGFRWVNEVPFNR